MLTLEILFKKMIIKYTKRFYYLVNHIFDIFQVIKKGFKLYSDELIIKVEKEEKNKSKNEQLFIINVCFIINTAEYCRDTLKNLEGK